MKADDFDRFKGLILAVAECYGQSLSPQGIALRFKALESYSYEAVHNATLNIINTRKYTTMPTPADFLEHIHGGSIDDKAEIEAGKVLEAIKAHGAYASVVFDNATTQAVIMQAYGGWPKICAHCGVEESEHWFRKNFAKTWAAYARQGMSYTGHMGGLVEIANSSSGHLTKIPSPRLVGDTEKAKSIAQEALQERSIVASLPTLKAHIGDE